MATTVVSGRVDEQIKQRVDRIIEREGRTAGDVIRDVWITIYETGKLPDAHESEAVFKEKRRRFQEFMNFLETLPPAPPWLATLTDEELRDMMVEDMLEEERHFVGGDLYVQTAR